MAPNTTRSPVSEIMDCFRVLVQEIASNSRRLESQSGITGAQMFVLQTLKQFGPLSIGDLAVRTHTHQSTVSIVVRKLEIKEYVQRKTGTDRRRQFLAITTSGSKLFSKRKQTVQQRLIDALAALPPESQEQLRDLLVEVLTSAGMSLSAAKLFLEQVGEPNQTKTKSNNK